MSFLTNRRLPFATMLKDVFGFIDYSLFQQIAMLSLAMAFLMICWGAMRLKRETASSYGAIPVDDLEPTQSLPSSHSNTRRADMPSGESQ
jgi:hypothetical protein